jgi:hypothetical protein
MSELYVGGLVRNLLSKNPKDFVQSYDAAIKLSEITDEKYTEKIGQALVQALSHPNPLTKAHSAEALGKMRYKNAVIALTSMLKDPYRLVRSYSARSLGLIRDETAVDALVSSLKNDEFFGVRAEAAEALGRICQQSGSERCKLVPKALMEQMKLEEERGEERRRRVLAEVALALARNQIESTLGSQLKALEEGRPLDLDERTVKKYEQGLKNLQPKLDEAYRMLKQREEKEDPGFKEIFRGIKEGVDRLRHFGELIDKMETQKDRIGFIVKSSTLLLGVIALLGAPPVGMLAVSLSLTGLLTNFVVS